MGAADVVGLVVVAMSIAAFIVILVGWRRAGIVDTRERRCDVQPDHEGGGPERR